jgi:hypothetical protein
MPEAEQNLPNCRERPRLSLSWRKHEDAEIFLLPRLLNTVAGTAEVGIAGRKDANERTCLLSWHAPFLLSIVLSI